MVDVVDRCILLAVICLVYVCQYVYSESVAADTHANRNKKQFEELEEANEQQREKDILKTYSTSKAHQFLTFEKCIQRMKCPTNRKEECSEECRAGNTEEEIEEHSELTKDEGRSSFKKAPKQKYEANLTPKKRSTKDKHSAPADKTEL